MKNIKEKVLAIYEKNRRFVPVIAFFGGFIWDAVALGRAVKTFDLVRLGFYFTVALVFLILLSASLESTDQRVAKERNAISQKASDLRAFALSRNLSDTWRFRFSYVVQFCFGGLFSAMIVCYFKSSGSILALMFVGVLAIFFVSNEFLQKSYEERFAVCLAQLTLTGAMYFNFLLPHLVSSVHFIWFIVSILLALLLCVAARRVAHKPWSVMSLPLIIAVLLFIARLFNWIPPVPLVLKDQNACTNFQKDYSCEIAIPTLPERIGLQYSTVYLKQNEPIYFVSSIYAPEKVKAQLEHRWYYKNPETDKYELKSSISSDKMATHGSREDGFRIYSKKRHVSVGRWKVETAIKGGAVIGTQTFYIKPVKDDSPDRMEWKIK